MGGYMQVVILCGGKGTRMREETEFKPKPLVEIGGRPILWHIMKIYSYYGLKEFILCLGYKGSLIKEYFLNLELFANDFTIDYTPEGHVIDVHNDDITDWKVTLADTGVDTETGGRVKKIQKYINGDTFLLTYGDAVADVNIEQLIAFHHEKGCAVTLTGIKPPSRFGILDVGNNGIASTFREKPVLDGRINGGFFVCDTKVFDVLDDNCVFEQAPLVGLASRGELGVYQHDGFWQCMDTYKEVESFNKNWDRNHRPWVIW
jgi:glucose-1-phosphate cytidylyltransferase